MPAVTQEAFSVLLKYMYTVKLSITCQNIGDVFNAARCLGVMPVADACEKVLLGKKKHDVYSTYVYVTARKIGNENVCAQALRTMCKRFEHIVGTKEFCDFSSDQIVEYLSSDILATRSEMVVFLGALKWLEYDYENRAPFVEKVLNCIRFQQMSMKEVLACFSPPMLQDIVKKKAVEEKLLKATCFLAAKSVNEEKRFTMYASKPRKYLSQKEEFVVWDPNISDPELRAKYAEEEADAKLREELAATGIQKTWRGYKVRQSILKDLGNRSDRLSDGSRTMSSSSISSRNKLDFHRSLKDYYSLKDAKSKGRLTAGSPKKSSLPQKDATEKPKVPSEEKTPKPKETKGKTPEVSPKREQTKVKGKEKDTAKTRGGCDHAEIGVSPSVERVAETLQELANDLVGSNSESSKESGPPKTSPEEPVTKLTSLSSPLAVEFTLLEHQKDILVSGGFITEDIDGEDSGLALLMFDTNTYRWTSIGKMMHPRHHHSSAYAEGFLYCIGGCHPKETQESNLIPQKTCEAFNLVDKEWTPLPDMGVCRMYHSANELEGKIYVCGGKDDQDRILKSVEVFDPKSKQWSDGPPLPFPTMGAGSCSHNGRIWIVGGMTQNPDVDVKVYIMDQVQCYESETHAWRTYEHRLPFPRAFCGVTGVGDHVYVIGGTAYENQTDYSETLKSIPDVVFTDGSQWEESIFLPEGRHGITAISVGSSLFTMGGSSREKKIAYQEVLILGENCCQWHECAKLPEELYGFSSAWVPKIEIRLS